MSAITVHTAPQDTTSATFQDELKAHTGSLISLGIISDTHDKIAPEIHEIFKGCDYILHAGDICRASTLWELELIAPVIFALGNNDNPFEFGEKDRVYDRRVELGGVKIQICHIERSMTYDPEADLIIVGHTHKPKLEHRGDALVVNPGSPTRSRGNGHYICKALIKDGTVASVEHIELP